jgi:hypothetical protein
MFHMKYDYTIHFSIHLSECEMLVVFIYNSIHDMKEKNCNASSNLEKKNQLTTFLFQSKIPDIHGLIHTYLQVSS